jgi:hypothetical protein
MEILKGSLQEVYLETSIWYNVLKTITELKLMPKQKTKRTLEREDLKRFKRNKRYFSTLRPLFHQQFVDGTKYSKSETANQTGRWC